MVRCKISEFGIFACSRHLFFRDRFPGFDSGLYAGLRLVEILSKTDKTVDELLEGINKYYATEEIKIKAADDIKFDIIEKIKNYSLDQKYPIIDIDGVKVLFDDSWALVRASNTGPNITLRFEARTEERLQEIKEEFENLVNSLI